MMEDESGPSDCNVRCEIAEELVVNKKPCPGLQVFDSSNCLRYFTKETILAEHLASNTTEHCIDSLVFSTIHHLVCKPEALFYLMSVCPEEEVVDVCTDVWQHNKMFRVSMLDVVKVFLNWGATLESLRISSDPQLVPTLPPTVLPNLPAPHNVKAVLNVIAQCLSNKEGNNADKQRCDLVKVLVTISLDPKLSQNRFKLHQAICKVLDTFPDWTLEKVTTLVEHLDLLSMGLQNATYAVCSFFAISSRVKHLKITAVHHLLQTKFGLPSHSPFQSLPPAEQLLERFQLVEIYVLIQLLNTLLIIYNWRQENKPDHRTGAAKHASFVAVIEELCTWEAALHSKLMAPKFVYTVEGGLIREKCARLRADCVELLFNLKNDTNQYQND